MRSSPLFTHADRAPAPSGALGERRGFDAGDGAATPGHRLADISLQPRGGPVTQRKATPIGRPSQPAAAAKGGLPAELKTGIESLSGVSMEGVRVHYNSPKPAQLRAEAYAQGRDIHVAPGREQHLPHEAWHLAQQAQGRVQATMQAKGLPINDSHELEKEADVMGAKALKIGRAQVAKAASAPAPEAAAPDAAISGPGSGAPAAGAPIHGPSAAPASPPAPGAGG